MVEIIFNLKSGKNEKTKKVLTFHIVEKHLEEVKKLLGITKLPHREKIENLEKQEGIVFRNMPEYRNDYEPLELNPSYKVMFPTKEDRDYFNELLKLNITDKTRSVWFPYRPTHRDTGMEWVCREVIQPKYPIYILSKGRWKTRYTAVTLDEMKVDYKIVVEPQEYDNYAKYISPEKILILPDEYLNKNQGGIPARNFIWEHSVKGGHDAHWVIDDNIRGFFRWNRNKRLPCKSGLCFKLVEDYFDSCENVGQCGLQYTSMFPEISMRRPLYIKNTRIYSCILQNNKVELEERWRGKYNEDTDLSLRLLKKGYSTLLFQNFQCGKMTTLSVKGGNSEIYAGDGLRLKLESLIQQHPDCVKRTSKFGKEYHHEVDYSFWKDNEIRYKKDYKFPVYPELKLVIGEVEVDSQE